MNRPAEGSTAECMCGADIRYAKMPDWMPRVRGRQYFWLGVPLSNNVDGASELSHLCYPMAKGKDGRAMHEPWDESSIRPPESEPVARPPIADSQSSEGK